MLSRILFSTASLFGFFLAGALSAKAEPVYLSCTYVNIKAKPGEEAAKPVPVEITLNESEQTASFHLPDTGFTKRLGATFQQKIILFSSKENKMGGQVDTDTWSLNRDDGTLIRKAVFYFPRLNEEIVVTWQGNCKKQPPIKRAF